MSGCNSSLQSYVHVQTLFLIQRTTKRPRLKVKHLYYSNTIVMNSRCVFSNVGCLQPHSNRPIYRPAKYSCSAAGSVCIFWYNLNVVCGSDEFQMSVEEIQMLIINCEALVGKPKIFFLHACQGFDSPEGCFVQTDSNGDERFLPHDNDAFLGVDFPPPRTCTHASRSSPTLAPGT